MSLANTSTSTKHVEPESAVAIRVETICKWNTGARERQFEDLVALTPLALILFWRPPDLLTKPHCMQEDTGVVTPKHFKQQLASFHPHFAGYNQHDSQVPPSPFPSCPHQWLPQLHSIVNGVLGLFLSITLCREERKKLPIDLMFSLSPMPQAKIYTPNRGFSSS